MTTKVVQFVKHVNFALNAQFACRHMFFYHLTSCLEFIALDRPCANDRFEYVVSISNGVSLGFSQIWSGRSSTWALQRARSTTRFWTRFWSARFLQEDTCLCFRWAEILLLVQCSLIIFHLSSQQYNNNTFLVNQLQCTHCHLEMH